jgi:hypothetical protein
MFLPLDALQPHSDRIEAVCAELFKEHVLLHAPLLQSTLDALGAQLSAVRSLTHTSGAATGSVTSADHEKQIEALAALFTTLDSQDIFAESLVQHTAADYAREAARFAPSASDVVEQERPEAMEITVFLQHVARRVQEEQARAMRLLATGREDVVHAAMKELLGGDGEGLISRECMARVCKGRLGEWQLVLGDQMDRRETRRAGPGISVQSPPPVSRA